jgi:hypothetical protein
LAGFQVIMYGRFWVFTEDTDRRSDPAIPIATEIV